MSNLQNRNPNNREVPPQQDGQVHHNSIPPKVDPEKAISYRDGYVHGRVSEHRVQEEGLEVRDNNNAARGLLIGIALTSLLGLTLGAIFFLNLNNQRQQEEYTAPPVVVPSAVTPASPSPAAAQPRQETQVIERTRTIEKPVLVPVPQVQSPAPQKAPQVNITVPPAARQQPAAAPAPQNNTINVTPAQPSTQTQQRTATPAQPNSTTQTAPSQQPTQIQPSLVTPTTPNQTQGQNSADDDDASSSSATPNGANTPSTGSTGNGAAGSPTTSGSGQ